MSEPSDVPEPRQVTLSPNEHDIVLRLLRRETARAIASATGRSVHTIRTTIRNIYDKVGIRGLAELADAVTRGNVMLIEGGPPKSKFSLTSAMQVLDRAAPRTVSSRMYSLRLHGDEIQALRNVARMYHALTGTQDDLASIIDRIERIVAVAESERSTVASAIAALLGAQDARLGALRSAAQLEALATVCADTPFALQADVRNLVRDAFLRSYAAGVRAAGSAGHDT